MKARASTSNVPDSPAAGSALQVLNTRRHREPSYQRVCDERKRPIRGLWIRGQRYYAQITLEDPASGQKQVRRVALENAHTPAQAKAALETLRVQRRKGESILQRRAPTFAVFAAEYLKHHQVAKDLKRASTIVTEGHAINRLNEELGKMPLDKIRRPHVDHFIAQRQAAGVSARTVNLEITVLRNVLKWAINRQLITRLPTENLRPLKGTTRKRELVPTEAIDRLCRSATEPRFFQGRLARPGETGAPLVNAEALVDYLRLMCYAGTRMAETLRLPWAAVDWDRRQLIVGADGQTKNGQSRAVDFNPKLEAHLRDMHARRLQDCKWLFPSPRGGELDRPAKTFRESIRLARQAAGLPTFGAHDCRHHFISMGVMAGIDYMTIARWVGHQDGGILIGRVYGHLSNEHAQRQAGKLKF